jgi:hypothetical protein
MRVNTGKGNLNEGGRDRLKLKFWKLPRSSPIGKHPYLDYVCSPNLERIRLSSSSSLTCSKSLKFTKRHSKTSFNLFVDQSAMVCEMLLNTPI